MTQRMLDQYPKLAMACGAREYARQQARWGRRLPLEIQDFQQMALVSLWRARDFPEGTTESSGLIYLMMQHDISDAIRTQYVDGRPGKFRSVKRDGYAATSTVTDLWGDETNRAQHVLDLVSAEAEDGYAIAEIEDAIARMHLTESEREILRLRREGYTLQAIADRFCVTESRISQITKVLGRRIREKIGA